MPREPEHRCAQQSPGQPLPIADRHRCPRVVDVGYQYDYNSNAPADVLNQVAAVNSLVAYLYGHLNQSTLDLPVNPDGSPSVTCRTANTCGVTDNGAVLECPDAQLLTNVVRESEKAVPQSGADQGTTSPASDPVATVDKPTEDEQHESEPTQSGATCNQPKANSGSAAEGDGS